MHRVICETEAGFIIGVSQTSVTIGSGRKMPSLAVFSVLTTAGATMPDSVYI